MNIKSLTKMAKGLPDSQMMPVLFVGHGNPMNALADNAITEGWKRMTRGLNPVVILCISAHWETLGTYVTATPKPRTIHDFGGFPKRLFEVQYPAPGAPEVARDITQTIQSVTVEEDHEWGLDHGTWSVLVKMFPEANVPVFQLSLNRKMSPKAHYELGRELQYLRRKGVLIVGSGNIVHNLRMAKWKADEPYDWAVAFDEQVKTLILNDEHETLLKADQLNSAAGLSIPTAEHYLPMLYTLGLKHGEDQLTFFNETIDMGSMSMRSFVLSQP